MSAGGAAPDRVYVNPVYPRSFPDPFVLRFRGEYWAYCTGFWTDGRCFGVLHSRDLVRWRERAGAMAPLPGGHTCYWAPEVVYLRGLFYLYYSVGNEERMEIRVAIADRPEGPFADSGRRLTGEPFAIDAHVFAAADGSRWLFYATDFLARPHVGTGTVRDRLLDPFTLAGEPRPVTLPRYDWQVYHPRRPEKGGVRWHTVEGPFVLARKGLLYQTFSGGNWQSSSYGVGYATSRAVDDPGEWSQAVDGVRTLPVLRSGGEVVGPGHNSVVRGPDGRQLYCVYHRWSAAANARPGIRTMAIDRLDWAGERLLVLGPTTTPQPAPALPAITVEGEIELAGAASPAWPVPPSFLCEVTARVVGDSGTGGWGFALHGDGGPLASLLARHDRVDAPAAFHLLRLEVDGARAMLEIEGIEVWRGRLTAPVTALSLVAEDAAAAFSGFALTPGWEELFVASGDPSALGWEVAAGEAVIRDARLWLTPADPAGAPAQISRGPAFARYELVVNARQEGEGRYAIFPALSPEGDDAKPVITLAVREGGWALGVEDAAGRREVPLPQGFDPAVDQQLRFRRAGGRIEIFWEGVALGEAAAAAGPARVGLGTFDGTASFEAVRVTAES